MRLLFTIILAFSYTFSYADYVDDGRKQYYGKIIEITRSHIVLAENCSSTNVKTFPWDDDLIIYFSQKCEHPGWDLSRSPVTAESNCQKRKVFQFFIKEKQQTSYADEFYIQNGILHITYAKGKGSVNYYATDMFESIEWVIFSTTCENDVPSDFEII